MSAFTNHLGLDEYVATTGQPILTEDGRAVWRVRGDLTWEVGELGSGEKITVPDGTLTDLGSIPQFAWSLGFAPDGYPRAYVVHDKLYRARGVNCGVLPYPPPLRGMRIISYSRRAADGILRDALRALGCGVVKRNIIWAAVRLGGAKAWGR